jgi:L-ascorbate metabolism protein UlaG (beta-lactamase superfamily)
MWAEEMIRMHEAIKVTWHGHSCFTLESGTWSLVLDPYDPAMIGYPPLKVRAHAMLASHQHGDHNHRAAVQFLPANPPILQEWLPGQDLPETGNAAGFFYRPVVTRHDETGGSKRGQNIVHVILAKGLRIVHLGDLGHILDPGQVAAIGRPDLLLIPVGGFYTIDAAAACRIIGQLQPTCVAPMHYQIGFGKLPIAEVDPFLKQLDASWTIERLPGPVLSFTGQQTGRCYVFRYQAAHAANE